MSEWVGKWRGESKGEIKAGTRGKLLCGTHMQTHRHQEAHHDWILYEVFSWATAECTSCKRWTCVHAHTLTHTQRSQRDTVENRNTCTHTQSEPVELELMWPRAAQRPATTHTCIHLRAICSWRYSLQKGFTADTLRQTAKGLKKKGRNCHNSLNQEIRRTGSQKMTNGEK